MTPKGVSSSKKVAKNGKKNAPSSCFKSTESSSCSDDVVEFPVKRQTDPRGKKPARGKKIANSKDTLP